MQMKLQLLELLLYSQDDQWVTSVLETTNCSYIATDLDPHVL